MLVHARNDDDLFVISFRFLIYSSENIWPKLAMTGRREQNHFDSFFSIYHNLKGSRFFRAEKAKKIHHDALIFAYFIL